MVGPFFSQPTVPVRGGLVRRLARCHDPLVNRSSIALVLAALAVGCSLEISGIADVEILDVDGGPDTDSTDVFVPGDDVEPDTIATDTDPTDAIDTSVGDTSKTDTGTTVAEVAIDTSPDTFVLDTGSLDTGAPDSGSPDTGPFDTGSPDTGPFDTGADVGPTAGSLSGTGAQFTATPLSLSTEGALDWAHWGRNDVGAWNHKSGANLITQGTNGSPSRWGEFPIAFTWVGGTPTATEATGTNDGIYHATIGNSFNFEVAAHHTQERTLKVYTTWNGSTGTITGTLSDNSAPPWASTIPPAGGTGNWIQVAVHTIKFRAGSPNQKLAVKITTTGGIYGIALLAATLQ